MNEDRQRVFNFPIVTETQEEIDRKIMLSKRIEIIQGMVVGYCDGKIYVSDLKSPTP